MWTSEARRNGNDSVWNSPFPAAEPGVSILEASNISPGLSGPACLLPVGMSVSMDLSASGTCCAAVDGDHCAQDSSAAVGVISLVDSSKRVVLDGRSQFLIDDSSFTTSVAVVRPHALAAAQAFLTPPRNERSKTEEAAIAAARAGRIPPRSSQDAGYMTIPKPGGIMHWNWLAMISYLVTEIVARFPIKIFASSRSGRIITALCCAVLPKLEDMSAVEDHP